MNVGMLEPLLRNATIKAIDGVSRKIDLAEDATETAVSRLLKHWNKMDEAQKEHVVGIVIATATSAVAAIVAISGNRKKKASRTGTLQLKSASKKAS